MDVVVNEALKAYIDPLTEDEYRALERSLLQEGCRDALVLWGDVLVDGHNRYALCSKHGLPFQTVQNTRFQSLADVQLWMIDQHLGRRSLSDFQRGVLALRKREIVAECQARQGGQPPLTLETSASSPGQPSAAPAQAAASDAFDTREALARAARLSSGQVSLIEKIQRQAAPEVVAAVKAGTLSINAAAAVASLPAEDQVAAATAGPDELKRAAKRVRESRRRPAAEASITPPAAFDPAESVQSLRDRVTALTAENAALRQQLKQLQAQQRAPVAGIGPSDETSPPF
jgi:hypothetical protein